MPFGDGTFGWTERPHGTRICGVKKPAAFFLLFMFSASQAFAQKPADPGIEGRVFTDETAIGEEINRSILSAFHPYTEPKLTGYVEKIGDSLAEHAERSDLHYRFTVLYDDKIYAASAPGGFVYLTTGMLFFLENEAELAAVLAHEIGELQYKDPKLSASKKILKQVTEAGAMIAPAFGPFGMLAALGFAGVHAVSEGSEKTPEQRVLAADRRALNYMVQAGYDPQGMIDLFYKFSSAKKEIMPYFLDYYQSRPITPERAAALQKRFAQLPLDGRNFDVHREQYMEMTKGVREIYKA